MEPKRGVSDGRLPEGKRASPQLPRPQPRVEVFAMSAMKDNDYLWREIQGSVWPCLGVKTGQAKRDVFLISMTRAAFLVVCPQGLRDKRSLFTVMVFVCFSSSSRSCRIW